MRKLIIPAGIIIVLLAGVAIWQRDALGEAMYQRTGEEDLLPQVRGMLQIAANPTRRVPRTEPYTLAQHADVNPFGINTFWQLEADPAVRDEQARLISEAGFTWIRQEFPWEDIEIHERGDFTDRRNNPAGVDAWAKYDHIVDTAEAYDITIMARLSNPPAWSRAAGDEGGPLAPPDDPQDYANYAEAVARRYAGRIAAYQLWNEPNIYPEWGEADPDPERYAELLCAGYHAIKVVDPDAIVVSGALAATSELSGRNLNDYVYLQRLYDAGGGECFDVLAMQGYGLWSGPTDHRRESFVVNYGRPEYIRDIMLRNGDADKAIWISEMNWNAAPEDVPPDYGRVTLEQQARWGPEAYQRAQEEWPWMGVINFWYFKRPDDSLEQAGRPEAYFRMSTSDFELQPVYYSMQDYALQAGVLYPGAHAPTDWAVAYEEEAGDEATMHFAFEGRALDLVLREGHTDVRLVACLDDSEQCEFITYTGNVVHIWRNPSVEWYDAKIRLDDRQAVEAIMVYGISPYRNTALGLAISAGLVGTGLWLRKRRHADLA